MVCNIRVSGVFLLCPYSKAMDRKLSATADLYMGDRRTRGPPNYRNIPLSRKEHDIALVSANKKDIIVSVALNHFFSLHQFKLIFQTTHRKFLNLYYFIYCMSYNTVDCIGLMLRVGLAQTGYGLEFRGLIPGRGKIFLFSIAAVPSLRPTQPRIQWVQGTVFPAVKWQGREADHSPPFSAEVKNGGAVPQLTSTSSRRDA
jgi:hypothetical protein